MGSCRYKCWRSHRHRDICVIAYDGAFDRVPPPISHLGPWVGSREGEVERLRPHYRALLAEQGFVVVHGPPGGFTSEA
jgi:hypothetical protein